MDQSHWRILSLESVEDNKRPAQSHVFGDSVSICSNTRAPFLRFKTGCVNEVKKWMTTCIFGIKKSFQMQKNHLFLNMEIRYIYIYLQYLLCNHLSFLNILYTSWFLNISNLHPLPKFGSTWILLMSSATASSSYSPIPAQRFQRQRRRENRFVQLRSSLVVMTSAVFYQKKNEKKKPSKTWDTPLFSKYHNKFQGKNLQLQTLFQVGCFFHHCISFCFNDPQKPPNLSTKAGRTKRFGTPLGANTLGGKHAFLAFKKGGDCKVLLSDNLCKCI